MPDVSLEHLRSLAEQVRAACLAAATGACEDAGLQGLCADGRLELARIAVAQVDLERLVGEWATALDKPPRSGQD